MLGDSTVSHASTYYFSSIAGNDNYTSVQAHSPATPWKSLEKLNAYFKYLSPGDSVVFKRGEVFNGGIIPSRSGAVFAPIYFGAYGSGRLPEINGLISLKNWKQVKAGIYESACEATGESLILNGNQQAIGRYPNKGYLSYESHNENFSITDNQLTDQINWMGAEIVIRKNRWIIDRSAIAGHNGSTITYAAGTKANPTNNFGYFIQNDARTLDQLGEWYYDRTRKSMMVYFGSKSPSAYTISTSVVHNLVDINRFNYLNFENIAFVGAGNNAFNIIQSKNIQIKNCSITQTGSEAVYANYTPFMVVKNCIISDALTNGINFDAGCSNSIISDNQIKNVGLIAGMGKSGSGTYEAITSFGDNTKIEKNRIDSVGYNGIYFGGNSSWAKNNYVAYFCLTKDDGAGIYIGDWSKTVNKRVESNIILHGIGNSAGATFTNSLQAEGIYIDDNSESVVINDNTVSQCANNGIKIHNAKDIDIFNNIVFNNGVQLRLEQDHYMASSSYIRNNNIRNNTFVSNGQQSTAKFSSHQDDIKAFGQIDSNVYCQSKNVASGNNIKASVVKNGKGFNQNYNLSNWQSAYGKDQSSTEVPSSSSVLFEYNASNKAKVITLNKPYVDMRNKIHRDKITISPYSSVLLVANTLGQAKATTITYASR
ncbi:right-handed parallel beta-helix repeat-containing protein [Mucilaginibacter lacusdianchii]|uniref:right-handed parallel beta-helix repeat-containing protein n=1 Tax=Mucilaginibacter lacusdianchii TaxID=2684211 RepID=UPI00131E3BDF|nr:right-handed parallel beta-helix repeat-containing protein [Mucilaginibacter sp. JXJ CY 39]